MKIWIPMLILLLSVAGLCIWDGVYTTKVFNKLSLDSEIVYNKLLSTSIEDEELKRRVKESSVMVLFLSVCPKWMLPE